MDLYIFILILFALFSCIEYIELQRSNKKISKRLFIFSAIILFVISTIRVNVGMDYLAYKYLYENLNWSFVEIKELGFFFILDFFRMLDAKYFVVTLIFAFVNIFFASKFILRYSMYPMLSLLIFYCFGQYFFNTLNASRQTMATYVLLSSIYLIDKEKLIKYITLVLCSGFFIHLSSIILSVVVLLKKVRFKFSWILIAILLCYAGYPILLNIIESTIYGVYINFEQYTTDFALSNYFLSIISILILLFCRKGTLEISILFYNLTALLFLSLFIAFLSSGTPLIMLFSRFIYFFSPILICILPNLIGKIKNTYYKSIFFIGITLLYCLILITALMLNGVDDKIVPYKSIFS